MPIAGRINLCTQRYYFFRRRGLVFSVERLKFDRLLENEILILQISFLQNFILRMTKSLPLLDGMFHLFQFDIPIFVYH